MAETIPTSQPPKQPAPYKKKGQVPEPVTPAVAAGGPVPAASEKVDAKHMGPDATRPFRYAGAFVMGTISHTLDGMALGGRRGLKYGLLGGFALWMLSAHSLGFTAIAALTGGSAFFIPLAGAAMLAVGLAIGGLVGLVTGGQKGVGRAYRKEKYADELATQEDVREVRRRRAGGTYHDLYNQGRLNANYNYDRMQQIARENQGDDMRYWRDRVDHERQGGHGWDRGGG